MSMTTTRAEHSPAAATADRGRWLRFSLLTVFTFVMLIPVLVTVVLALRPEPSSGIDGPATTANFEHVISDTYTLTWLGNSILVALASVGIAIVVSAPAGYVLSRGRGKLVSGYSLSLFVIQALPVIVLVVPLFMLFAPLQLVDSLIGVTIIYVGSTLSVTTWMLAAYFDTIPIALEEAGWIDGCSIFRGFIRIVLRNSLPGVLSAAIFAFLQAWNDYLIAIVFLRSNPTLTLQVGLQTFFQQNQTAWGPVMAISVIMLLPPVIVFATFNKYFSVGGIGGSLAGR